ncbi:MAG: heavy metal efflux system protein, partial [Hyphomonadaceae bacterium]
MTPISPFTNDMNTASVIGPTKPVQDKRSFLVHWPNHQMQRLLIIPLVILFLSPSPLLALDNTIKISTEHSKNLGVTLGNLTRITQIPLLYAPAKVVVPPSQEFIVSGSQAGLITKLTAAIGD